MQGHSHRRLAQSAAAPAWLNLSMYISYFPGTAATSCGALSAVITSYGSNRASQRFAMNLVFAALLLA